MNGGSKVISYERTLSDFANRAIVLKLYDLNTETSKTILKVDWEHVGRATLEVSDDDKKFVFCVAGASACWVGELQGEEVKLTKLDGFDIIWSARFVNQDKQVVLLTSSERIVYEAVDWTKQPLREENLLADPECVSYFDTVLKKV
ncbi:MAG: hypothetical protein M3Q07_19685 [Pseudobdellovibrionaceae bacterium]|nr:hypothetical protein [Pseudobdellovibrionaceae bacterium]